VMLETGFTGGVDAGYFDGYSGGCRFESCHMRDQKTGFKMNLVFTTSRCSSMAERHTCVACSPAKNWTFSRVVKIPVTSHAGDAGLEPCRRGCDVV
jgi:hypothetical protein